MSAITCNGKPILSGEITHPRKGAWTASLDIVSETILAGRIELKSFDDRWRLIGTAIRAEVFADSLRVFVVAGNGGLAKQVKAKGYTKAPAKTIVDDLLGEVGEKLSASAKVPGTLESWTRIEGRADEALTDLVEFLGLTWRVDPTGEVWIGTDTYPEASDPEALTMDSNAASGSIVVASPAPFYVPGVTVQKQKVETVVHTIGDQFTSRLFVGGSDRIRGALETLVRKTLRVDRFGAYFCKVVSQNSDGTLELLPDLPKIPGTSKVPIKLGVPGITVKVKPGARVALTWDGGDFTKPRATVWDSDGLDTITITAKTKVVIDAPDIVAQKGRPLARLGDMVMVISTPPGTPAVGQITTANTHHKG